MTEQLNKAIESIWKYLKGVFKAINRGALSD